MAKSVFTKNKLKVFFIFLLVAAIMSVGAAIGLYYYFGHSVPGGDITEGLGDKLSYGGSFTVEDIIEEEQYNYAWIKSDDIIVEVYAKNKENDSILTKEILQYTKEDRTFNVIGVSQGFIKFINGFDETVNFCVPFTTKFKSNDTKLLLTENYPQFIEDGIFTQSELQEVEIIRFENVASADLNDFKLLKNLKKIEIRETPENSLISFSNFNLPLSTSIYVEDEQYLDYVNNEDVLWQNYVDRIYPIVANVTSHSIVLYKNGGVFADDNGEMIASFEVENGGTVSLSTTYEITKQGYQFLGWYSKDSDVVVDADLVTDTYEFKSDMKLYARWQANNYTIKLHYNDGTSDYTEKQFTYDREDVICDAPLSYSGFVQIGWAYEEDAIEVVYSNEQVIKNITFNNNEIIDVYAIWVYKTFSIQFYTWDTEQKYQTYGSIKQGSYGDNIALSLTTGAPPVSIYGSFKGWALKEEASKAEYAYNEVVLFEDIKNLLTSKTDGVLRVYPVFQLESYDLSYDANGGSTKPNGENGIARGTAINLSKQIEREGFKFKGWLDNAGYLWVSEALYDSDQAYYDANYPNKVEQLVENEYGYVAPIGMEHVQSTKVTLTAIWVANKFNVVFAGNQTDAKYYNSATITYGEEYRFDGELSKKGHSLSSCVSNYGNVSLSGKVLSVEQIATIYNALRGSTLNNDFNCGGTVTFNVSWSANTYKITFNYDGGSGSETTRYIVYGSTYGTLPSASKSNKANCDKSNHCYTSYSLSSWMYGNQSVTASTVMNIDGDHELKAKWSSKDTTASHDSCVVAGTLITMADGTKKPVESLKLGETVTTFNHFTGEKDSAPVVFIYSEEVKEYPILKLFFNDGKELSIVNMHGLFDANLNEYVMIDYINVVDYLNHEFVCIGDGKISTSKLVGYNISIQSTTRYTLITAQHINNLFNEFLCVSDEIEGLYNVFELDDNMRVDESKYNQDIAKYGLSAYDEWADYITYEEYVAFNGKYMNVAFGKGLTTKLDILELIKKYIHPDIIF